MSDPLAESLSVCITLNSLHYHKLFCAEGAALKDYVQDKFYGN